MTNGQDILRALTAQEEIYWRLTYNDQIHVIVAAETKGHVSVESWQHALIRLQHTNQILSSSIDMPSDDNSLLQPVFTKSLNVPIPLRLIDRADFTLESEIEAELAIPFVEGQAPLCRLALAHREDGATAIMSVSHSVGDGTTGLVLMRDLLRGVGGVEALPAPVTSTAPAVLGVASVPPTRRIIDGEPKRSPNAGRRPTVALFQLDRERTEAIVTACRARGSTVHSALAAATVTELRRRWADHASREITIISPVDTRALLGLPDDAVGLYFTSPQSRYPAGSEDDFWAMAHLTRKDIAGAATEDAVREVTKGMQAYTQAGLTNASANESLDSVFAMNVLLTNLGRTSFGADFGDIRVERLWGPIVLGGRDHVQTIGVVTIEGKLHLAHISREPVTDLLGAIVNILIDETKEFSKVAEPICGPIAMKRTFHREP